MRRAFSFLVLPLIVVLAVAVMASVYIVDVREKALVLRFGEVVAVREEPGLGFKLPVIDRVVRYDARILGLPVESMEVTPLDDRRLVVDAFARWQIADAVAFRRATGEGGVDFAQGRLAGILTNAIRGVLGSVPSTTVLSDDRTAASRTAEQLAAALGVSWTVRAGLRDLVGSTGRVPALDEIADLHRGEAVVVVGGSLGEAILALEGDADGWSDRVWPGQNSRSVGSSPLIVSGIGG